MSAALTWLILLAYLGLVVWLVLFAGRRKQRRRDVADVHRAARTSGFVAEQQQQHDRLHQARMRTGR